MIIYRHSLHTTNAHAQPLSRERFVYHTSCIAKIHGYWYMATGTSIAWLRKSGFTLWWKVIIPKRWSQQSGMSWRATRGYSTLITTRLSKSRQRRAGWLAMFPPSRPGSDPRDPGVCFTNVSRILQSNLKKYSMPEFTFMVKILC